MSKLSAKHQVLQGVLNSIQRDWSFMLDANCVPVQVALQFMDSSSLGRANQSQQFHDTFNQLQRALKAIVNEHHEGFSNSIGLFHQIQSSISASQRRVRMLRDSLVMAKASLSTTKPEFKRLATSSQEYDDMLQILAKIEELQQVPELLEARISEKNFWSAVDLLLNALRITKDPEMANITALTELRVYVANQETSLIDILIEELHSHLYLKSPYSQERWRSSVMGLDAMMKGPPEATPAGVPSTKPLDVFLENLNLSVPLTDDTSRNLEADNFVYIQLLLEAFNKLGRLNLAVESIEQRMPTELFRLVDRTYTEVDQRRRNATGAPSQGRRARFELGSQDDETRGAIITDFLETLYSKLESIAEGHRALHDVIEGIVKREGITDAENLTGGFKELWKLYQNEIRTILHDYLATDGHSAFRSAQGQPGGRLPKRAQRDKSKSLFKLSNIDDTSADLATAQDELNGILKMSVPGLVSESRRPFGQTSKDGKGQAEVSATGHILLAEPSVFNMGYLLRPSLAFVRRLGEIVPAGSDIPPSKLTSFLDDFMVNVFQPQLDETLTESSAQIIIGLDAFQVDPEWAAVARRPIFRGTRGFYNLITTMCRLLDSIPHDQAFTQPVIAQMITYYDKCRGLYKSLVTRANSQSQAGSGIRLKAAAAASESEGLRETAARLWTDTKDDQQILIQRETQLLIERTQESPLDAADVISDRKSITSLCLLYTSMKWLASKMTSLRRISDSSSSHGSTSNKFEGTPRLSHSWTTYDTSHAKINKNNNNTPVYLPLTSEVASSFDAVIASYEELASLVLFTIHMEIRHQIIFRLTESLVTKSNYTLDADQQNPDQQSMNEPDPGIIEFNTDLIRFDEDILTYFREQEHTFITKGLGHLIDTLIIKVSSGIKSMNKPGCLKMQMNLLILQQNLRNIEPDVLLKRSACYFDLFMKGPDGIIDMARNVLASKTGEESGAGGGNPGGGEVGGEVKKDGDGKDEKKDGEKKDEELGFKHEELKFLIELCYSESLSSERREAAMQAKRQLSEKLLRLSEFTWQT